jgi:inhibitor of KinA
MLAIQSRLTVETSGARACVVNLWSLSAAMQFTPLGDSALILRICDDFDADPERCLRRVLTAVEQLRAANIIGVTEVTPAYSTVALSFDAAAVAAAAGSTPMSDWLAVAIDAALDVTSLNSLEAPSREVVEVPVCYDDEFAVDLDAVAQHTGLRKEDVVRLHSAAEYRVHCVGFTPGFPYLGGLPKELTTPRRSTPRVEVPAGSVAIGGSQTGVYPMQSPGGWHVIGRTPIVLFSAVDNPPARLRAGDRVRFRRITRDEFDNIRR